MFTSIHTSSMAVGDLSLSDWVVFELPKQGNAEGVDRHIFGYCPETYKWQLSSSILAEMADQYIETRSRKYFKNGPTTGTLPPEGLDVLQYLLRQWRESEEVIEELVEKLGGFPK